MSTPVVLQKKRKGMFKSRYLPGLITVSIVAVINHISDMGRGTAELFTGVTYVFMVFDERN